MMGINQVLVMGALGEGKHESGCSHHLDGWVGGVFIEFTNSNKSAPLHSATPFSPPVSHVPQN